MNALEFVNGLEFPVIRIAGNGAPAGQDIAFIGGETELPFDLEEIEGIVEEDGGFVATNLNDGSARKPGSTYSDHVASWWVRDWRGNLITALWIRNDEAVYSQQYSDWEAGV